MCIGTRVRNRFKINAKANAMACACRPAGHLSTHWRRQQHRGGSAEENIHLHPGPRARLNRTYACVRRTT